MHYYSWKKSRLWTVALGETKNHFPLSATIYLLLQLVLSDTSLPEGSGVFRFASLTLFGCVMTLRVKFVEKCCRLLMWLRCYLDRMSIIIIFSMDKGNWCYERECWYLLILWKSVAKIWLEALFYFSPGLMFIYIRWILVGATYVFWLKGQLWDE